MEKVPDYSSKNRYASGGSEYARKDIYEPSRDVGSKDVGGNLRSPQMQFLSPVLSTPKYDSNAVSVVNSLNRKDEKADIYSPNTNLLF